MKGLVGIQAGKKIFEKKYVTKTLPVFLLLLLLLLFSPSSNDELILYILYTLFIYLYKYGLRTKHGEYGAKLSFSIY